MASKKIYMVAADDRDFSPSFFLRECMLDLVGSQTELELTTDLTHPFQSIVEWNSENYTWFKFKSPMLQILTQSHFVSSFLNIKSFFPCPVAIHTILENVSAVVYKCHITKNSSNGNRCMRNYFLENHYRRKVSPQDCTEEGYSPPHLTINHI